MGNQCTKMEATLTIVEARAVAAMEEVFNQGIIPEQLLA